MSTLGSYEIEDYSAFVGEVVEVELVSIAGEGDCVGAGAAGAYQNVYKVLLSIIFGVMNNIKYLYNNNIIDNNTNYIIIIIIIVIKINNIIIIIVTIVVLSTLDNNNSITNNNNNAWCHSIIINILVQRYNLQILKRATYSLAMIKKK